MYPLLTPYDVWGMFGEIPGDCIILFHHHHINFVMDIKAVLVAISMYFLN